MTAARRVGTRRAGIPAAASLVAMLVVVGVLCAVPAARSAATPPAPVRVQVDPTAVSNPLAEGFLGVALEESTIPLWVGPATTPAQVDPVLVQLLRNLNPVGSPSIRVGGQSSDRTWWPIPGATGPIGVDYSIGPPWATAALLLAERLNARYLMSVNLEADSTQITEYEADHLLAAIGPRYIQDFEIGNEPDLYTHTAWYRILDGELQPWYDKRGTPYYSRPPSYDEADFLAEVENTLKVMPPDIRIAGPDAAQSQWIGPFSRLIARTGRIGMLTAHAYALFTCDQNPLTANYPSIPHLLALSAAQRLTDGPSAYLKVAERANIPLRIDELGSVSCNGRNGVSNSFASALWVTDALFQMARENIDGVNLHSFPGSDNGLFDLADTVAGWQADVHPLYYGALMFALADPEGARVLSIPTSSPASIRVWATMDAHKVVRVLIINVGAQQAVTVSGPAGYDDEPARVDQMLAPSVAAQTGVTIGGRAIDPATGGLPAAAPRLADPRQGDYTVVAPAGSETLLTLSLRPTPKRPTKRAKPTTSKKPTPKR